MKKDELLVPINLQFFGANPEDEDEKPEDQLDDEAGEQEDNDDEKQDEDKKKKPDLNKLLANEKRTGRNSVLKALGFTDAELSTKDGYKKAMGTLKGVMEANQTEAEKTKRKLEQAEADTKRANLAETKLTLITQHGANLEMVDGLMGIVQSKLNEDTTIEEIITELKNNKSYAPFFSKIVGNDEEEQDGGTGNPNPNKRQKGKGPTLAQRLIDGRANPNKSHYFK